MTRLLLLTVAVAISSAFLCGCPDDKATTDTKATTTAASAAPAASAKPAAKGGW